MSALDQLAKRWPGLDMAKLRILREIESRPGCGICDIAEALRVDHQHVQFHVATMAGGKKDRERAALGLVTISKNQFDRRRKELSLTKQGRQVLKLARPLIGSDHKTETQLELQEQ
ncbi:MAG: hypothetical protein V7707_08075 [Motiliproteus sp.]